MSQQLLEALPQATWLKADTWVCHIPTKTIFQLSGMQRAKASNMIYLLDCRGDRYPLVECAPSSLDHLKGVALLILEYSVSTVFPVEGGWQIESKGEKSGKIFRNLMKIPGVQPEVVQSVQQRVPASTGDDPVLDAARSLANVFNGVVVDGSEVGDEF